MNRYIVLSVLALLSSDFRSSAQESSTITEPGAFVAAIEKTDSTGIFFNQETLDSAPYRIDSVFVADSSHDGYFFISRDKLGQVLGRGYFHFHSPDLEFYYTREESQRFLTETHIWTHLHVSSFQNPGMAEHRFYKLFFCQGNSNSWASFIFGNPVITLRSPGSTNGYVYSKEEIQRMPTRLLNQLK